MPNTKSAQKALRQSLRRRKRNLERREKLKSAIKAYKKSIEAGKIEEAKELLVNVYKIADKLAKVNFIKENKARRIKSRMAKKLNKIIAQS